ncbi:MAG TPA: serine--tRNA ligase, partial [Synergistales bacterium]|nr:serine--tRNA ligase [Synergistales bacterium]
MLDMKWIRNNVEEVKIYLANRNHDFPLDELLGLDEMKRACLTETENLKSERNEGSKEVAKRGSSGQDTEELKERMREIGSRIREIDLEISRIDSELGNLLLSIPNKPDQSVPIGADDTANIEIRQWGNPTVFPFTPKAHWDIGEGLGILDFERGAKLAESRFTALKGSGSRLSRALINFMLDLHTSYHGYTEVEPPFLVNSITMQGTGQL